MSTLTEHVFRLPDLGEGLTEAGLVQWLVAVGDTIVTDQPIAEVETAKSIVELPSPFAGTVTALHGEAGDTLAVGAPVLEVMDAPAITDTATAADAESEAYRTEERAGSGNVLIGYGTTERGGPGRRRARARAGASGSTAVSGSAADSTVGSTVGSTSVPTLLPSPADAPTPPRRSETGTARPVAVRSPLVRRLARDLGIDVHTIPATGTDGAITRADVLRAAVDHAVDGVGASTSGTSAGSASGASGSASAPASGSASASASARASAPSAATANAVEIDGLRVSARERMSPLRKAVSARLGRSRSEIPEATVWVDVDASRLWQLRREMATADGGSPSLTALIARFTLIALEEHPVLASRLSDDGSEIIAFEGVNLGIAADTERGLLVPVVPRAHDLSLGALDEALRELSATARAGVMPPDRLRGSTFTLNNYGGLGVDGSAAIINHPDVAILGIGRILERAWVVDGEVAVRRVAQLSLVFDHRVCDGGYAASFLRRVAGLIEHPLQAFGRV